MDDALSESQKSRLRFEGLCHDLPEALPGVSIRVVDGYMKQGWLEIVVALDESTTRKNLLEAYPIINEWRNRLVEYQGPWTGGGDNELYERLSTMHPGRSYNTIARNLNDLLARQVERLVKALRALEKRPGAEYFLGDPGVEREYWDTYLVPRQIVGLLVAMGMSNPKAQQWLDEAIERSKKGEVVASSQDPITGQYGMVRDRIKTWREKRKPD